MMSFRISVQKSWEWCTPKQRCSWLLCVLDSSRDEGAVQTWDYSTAAVGVQLLCDEQQKQVSGIGRTPRKVDSRRNKWITSLMWLSEEAKKTHWPFMEDLVRDEWDWFTVFLSVICICRCWEACAYTWIFIYLFQAINVHKVIAL